MQKIAWVTCEKFSQFHPREIELINELKKTYIVEPLVWTKKIPRENEYDAVIIRTPWDYYERIQEFRHWLNQLPSKKVYNPKDVLIWNLDKVYLKELELAGVSIVPTKWLKVESEEQLRSWVSQAPWGELILKPTVSAGAFKTINIHKASAFDASQYINETVMLQPFLNEVVGLGELSFVYFAETFSHAVCKKPKANDFRVQYTHGGTESTHIPTESELIFGKQIHNALRSIGFKELLYTRIDFLNTNNGIMLMELEVLEPDLFLKSCEQSSANFKNALQHFINKGD